jgi:dehydrodolichyl diphosphate syntase complex subunit NUS1
MRITAGLTEVISGKLKSHKDLVHQNVAIKLLRHYGAGRHNFNVYVSGIGQPKTTKKCGPAGFSLLLLSAQDGRESLAEICNVMESSIRRGESLPEEINTAQIDKMLKAKLLASLHDNPIDKVSHPIAKGMIVGSRKGIRGNNRNTLSLRVLDPDILFMFGSSIQFDGYPPWQLANPEIFCADENLEDFGRHGRSIAYRIFLQGLHRYAGADIRLGR